MPRVGVWSRGGRARLGWGALLILAALARPWPAAASEAERCAAVRAGTAATAPPLPVPYRPEADTAPVLLRVAGVRYAIPANYFRHPAIGCDTEEGDLLLRVVLPGHLGYAPERKALFNDGRHTMNVLLRTLERGDGSLGLPPEPMNRTMAAYAEGADRLGDHPLWDGLLRTIDRFGRDVFFTRDGAGEVTFLMVCLLQAQPGERPHPGIASYPRCDQFFPYHGAYVKQHFHRETWLERWREVRDGTVRLLDGFAEAGAEAATTAEAAAAGR